MIAQAYCGGTHFHGGLRCNTTDGACPKCLRSHIARLEAHARELDGELSVARMAATECESACRELEDMDRLRSQLAGFIDLIRRRYPRLLERGNPMYDGLLADAVRMAEDGGALNQANNEIDRLRARVEELENQPRANELRALRNLFAAAGRTIHAASAGGRATLEEINDAWAEVCAAHVANRDLPAPDVVPVPMEELAVLREIVCLLDEARQRYDKHPRGAGGQRMPDEIDDLLCRLYEMGAHPASRALGEGFAAVSEEELVALRCLDDAVTINGDGMSVEALGVDWDVARSAKRRLVNIRAAKGGAT